MRSAIYQALERIKANCVRFQVVGALRLGEQAAAKMEFVIIPKVAEQKDPMDFFANQTISAVDAEVAKLVAEGVLERVKDHVRFKDTFIVLVLNVVKESEFIPAVIKKSCTKNYWIEILTMCKGKGYQWTANGLKKSDGRVSGPVFFVPESEEDFFKFLNMPWTDFKDRKYGSVYPGEVTRQDTLTPEEMDAWINKSRWVDTKCGGEWHQYTVRPAQKSDELFRFIVDSIYRNGYDGQYLGMTWRYLDHKGFRYFANGYRIEETHIVNRKQYMPGHTVREWKPNPVSFGKKTLRDTR